MNRSSQKYQLRDCIRTAKDESILFQTHGHSFRVVHCNSEHEQAVFTRPLV